MALVLKEGASWGEVYARAMGAAPEAFDRDRIRNLVVGEWLRTGEPGEHRNPVDNEPIEGPPRVNRDEAIAAVRATVERHAEWSSVGLDERRDRVARAVAAMRGHRELLALLLVWEIGKPWKLACADVDRCLEGVEWYVAEAERQLEGRKPLDGPVSNIASWNYPMSVQVHAELVQMLAGNAVVAKTPSQGGFHCLTLAHALMAREGLPVTLVSGKGSSLGDILIRGDGIGCLAFVGGRSTGRKAATALADTGRRHFLEQEGLNAWGVWDFSQWDLLAGHIRKGFQYAKQRCTAYPRYVVQRGLFPEFLEAYRPVVDALRFGHPLAVERPTDPYPELDFGPVISAGKASELRDNFEEGVRAGGIPLVRRALSDGAFLAGQDTSAYVAPATLLEPPASWTLRHSEPFGPLDSIVLVDSEAELIAAMNASNGALVASVATDDTDLAHRVAEELQAFKIGINAPRSRGDREEIFGGKGASWKGAFVGGDLLVQAVTQPSDGSSERLYGNFSTYASYPPGAGLPVAG
ncbi:MAG: aldehyde dehydrogenase family protein [Planctomycetota bacterium]